MRRTDGKLKKKLTAKRRSEAENLSRVGITKDSGHIGR